MKYLFQKKDSPRAEDTLSSFFSSICGTARTFYPYLQNIADQDTVSETDVTDLAISLRGLTGSNPESRRHVRVMGPGVSATARHRPTQQSGCLWLLYVPSHRLAGISQILFRWGLPLIKPCRPRWVNGTCTSRLHTICPTHAERGWTKKTFWKSISPTHNHVVTLWPT
jgi:hypothetical protein